MAKQKKEIDPHVREYIRSIAKKGGKAVKEKYGPEHFSKMGKLGGRPRKSSSTKAAK